MGQSLQKLAPGSEKKKLEEISSIIDGCYQDYFIDGSMASVEFTEFYRGVSCTVEKINRQLGYTQLELPQIEKLKTAYNKHHKGKDKALTKAEFQDIMKEVMTGNPGFTGLGAKDTLLYIFGVPVAALLLKQKVMPRAIPDEFFIPGITSVTALVLAALNKI